MNPLYLQEDHAGVLAAKEKEVVAKDKELVGKKEELEKGTEEHKKALQTALNAAEKIRKQLNVNPSFSHTMSLYLSHTHSLSPSFSHTLSHTLSHTDRKPCRGLGGEGVGCGCRGWEVGCTGIPRS